MVKNKTKKFIMQNYFIKCWIIHFRWCGSLNRVMLQTSLKLRLTGSEDAVSMSLKCFKTLSNYEKCSVNRAGRVSREHVAGY